MATTAGPNHYACIPAGSATMLSLAKLAASFAWLNGCIIICNTSNVADVAYISHDTAGATFDKTTAIMWGVPVAANTTVILGFKIAELVTDAEIQCASDGGNLNFHMNVLVITI